MSKVPYTINVERYICSELDEMRDMVKNLDFSGLAAAIERVQHHASAMEQALYRYQDLKYRFSSKVKDKDLSDEAFRKEVKKAFKGFEK